MTLIEHNLLTISEHYGDYMLEFIDGKYHWGENTTTVLIVIKPNKMQISIGWWDGGDLLINDYQMYNLINHFIMTDECINGSITEYCKKILSSDQS